MDLYLVATAYEFFPEEVLLSEIHGPHREAMKKFIKSLYK